MGFVPKKGEKEVISFRISKELLRKIDMLSNANSLSRNEFMVQCIEFAISSMDEPDEPDNEREV